MGRFIFVFIICFFCLFSLKAQKENNYWYFGNNAGLDFNNGTPVALTDGELITNEGCATVSDYAGNLLFYTDGVNVWDRLHTRMLNGDSLMGDSSSTQSALIVKKPRADSIYYIFTTAADSGLRYSIVDLTLNAGLGDVTADKNILVFTPSCEKLTAIRNFNGIDYWIIAHHKGTNSFYSYMLNSTGLSSNVVITNIGSSINNPKGYLKGSPDGSKIVNVNRGQGWLELFDFSNQTGLLSSLITIDNFSSDSLYGVEFSPNNNFLYVSQELPYSYIYQYDLFSGSDINSTRVQIDSIGEGGGALQLGTDNKIYYARKGEEYLGVINEPNQQGIGCDYVENQTYLNGEISMLGLPPFVIYENFFSPHNLCLGDTTQFRLFVTTTPDSVKWDFGDPSSGIFNYSTLINPSHYYSNLGSYDITVIIYRAGQVDTLKQTIEINPYPVVSIGNDTLLCPGDIIILDATTPNASYAWNNGTNSAFYNVASQGTYWVEVEVNGCVTTDSIVIKDKFKKFSLGPDIYFCYDETHLIDLNIPEVSYTWQDGSSDSYFHITEKGKYWVTVKLDECINSDTLLVGYNTTPKKNFNNDTIICKGKSILLNVKADNSTFLWQDYSTHDFFEIKEEGAYWIYVADEKCDYLYKINVELEQCEIEMPNVFTPNNDGLNERFIPFEIEEKTQGALFIYNRFGKKVFETENLGMGWDGKFNGKECTEGTYFWILNFNTITYGELSIRGFVTLLR
ncbi:MAG: gliding motility-associated C-terminal domain-containing protein [Bacteroidota bacterium]|nr:gliding motility-associated C-terminal domain-containing protein [Bacteroidota bacterium]